MLITLENIQAALREEDIEGLISLGAPGDEYDAEANGIEKAIVRLSVNEQNIVRITAVIATVWEKAFNRSSHEIEMRMPAFQRVASRLLK